MRIYPTTVQSLLHYPYTFYPHAHMYFRDMLNGVDYTMIYLIRTMPNIIILKVKYPMM